MKPGSGNRDGQRPSLAMAAFPTNPEPALSTDECLVIPHP